MSPRRKLEALVAMGLAGALAWTAFGPFSTASGQEAPIVIDRAHKGAHRPSFTEPIFILVLGGDARSGNPDRQGIDSIHIVGIDPVQNRAALLGIPRDSYVPSSQGYGNRKLTDLGRLEGVDGLIQSVEGFSQCTFDYYMITAFDGFRGPVRYPGGEPDKLGPGLIDDIGGVTVNVTENLSEPNPVPVPRGRNVLDGGQALSYARNRHQRPGGDFDRSEAQGVLMIAILAEMRRDFAEDAGTALRNIAAIRRHVNLNIPLGESLDLGLMGLQLKPRRVENRVVDGAIGSAGTASIVRITAQGRAQLADICADGLLDSTN